MQEDCDRYHLINAFDNRRFSDTSGGRQGFKAAIGTHATTTCLKRVSLFGGALRVSYGCGSLGHLAGPSEQLGSLEQRLCTCNKAFPAFRDI